MHIWWTKIEGKTVPLQWSFVEGKCCVRKPVAASHILDLAQGPTERVDWLTLARQLVLRTHCYSISLFILVLY